MRVRWPLLAVACALVGCQGAGFGPGGPHPCAAPAAAAPLAGVQDVERPFEGEAYDAIDENPFVRVADSPLSTFSIDVDTASYSNVRRMLAQGTFPPAGAVRVEELVNYFPYAYEPPQGDEPFSIGVESAACPWAPANRLVRVGLRAREVAKESRLPGNFVFLLDVSGSMQSENKLPLVKRSMRMLLDTLDPRDRVAIVVYAGASGLVLPSTSCEEKATIAEAIAGLEAAGSTNGAEGIELAYAEARKGFVRGGVNRVVLCTDGDWNVGVTDQSSLVALIRRKAREGVFLTVLGFGMGNYKDSTLERLADEGNGNYGYVDSEVEARKLLVEQAGGTLVTVAKDVKVQVEWNPSRVEAYRLLGYENRLLANQDFNDDAKDAGEIGAGHTVTAFYEVVPEGTGASLPSVDPLKYQRASGSLTEAARSGESLTVKVRYKEPEGEESRLLSLAHVDAGETFDRASQDFRFAASVASFGLLLRESAHAGSATYDSVLAAAGGAVGRDEGGYREAFLELVRRARGLRLAERRLH
jgi:Ca-activated chloride channel family protein